MGSGAGAPAGCGAEPREENFDETLPFSTIFFGFFSERPLPKAAKFARQRATSRRRSLIDRSELLVLQLLCAAAALLPLLLRRRRACPRAHSARSAARSDSELPALHTNAATARHDDGNTKRRAAARRSSAAERRLMVTPSC